MIRKLLRPALLAMVLLCVLCIQPTHANAAAMDVSEPFIEVLKKIEGFSAKPYWDNSQYSIGYGSYCPDSMVSYYNANPLTQEQAVVMLKEQLVTYINAVNNFAATHNLSLQQHQFDALVSFTYNVGTGWTNELDGYFNVAVREGDMGNGFIYGLTLWSTSAGQYILTNRRMCEANMYLNGVYKAYNDGNGTGNYPDSYRWVFLDGGAGTVSYRICGFDANLNGPINVAFKSIPTGTDSSGNPFAYTFAGWYTADGRKVEVLDASLTRGQTLYAKWADPQGNIVTPPAQSPPESSFPKTGTVVNVNNNVNIRTGPGTNYAKNGTRDKGARVTILAESTGSSYTVNGTTYNTWGKISDNEWIALGYVQYDDHYLTGIRLVRLPTVTDYTQPVIWPKLEGSVLLVTYSNGYSEAMTVTKKMISGFDGNRTGTQTVTVTYSGKTTTFQVTVRSGVPDSITSDTYRIENGMLLGVAPGTTADQLLAGINERGYVKLYGFAGEVTGNMPVGTDMMVVLMDGDNFIAAVSVVIKGDVNGDGTIDGMDATLLLQYAAGWEVPVNEFAADVNGDGNTDGMDATLLLQYAAGWDVAIN